MTLKNEKEVRKMKKMFQILTRVLKGGKILKGLKMVKEILSFLKSIVIILGASMLVNTLEFINGFKFLNSNITSLLITCISWTMYLYIGIQTIKTLLKFIPIVKEIINNPIVKKLVEKIKTSFKEWNAIIKAKTHKED